MTPDCWWPLMKPILGRLIAWAEVLPVWGYDAGRPERVRGPPDARSQLRNRIASPKGTAS